MESLGGNGGLNCLIRIASAEHATTKRLHTASQDTFGRHDSTTDRDVNNVVGTMATSEKLLLGVAGDEGTRNLLGGRGDG